MEYLEYLLIIIKVYALKLIASYAVYKILRRMCKVSRTEMLYEIGRPLIEVSAWSIVLFMIIFFLILSSNSNLSLSNGYIIYYFCTASICDFLLLLSAIKLGIRKRINYTEIVITKKSYFDFLNPIKILRLVITAIES